MANGYGGSSSTPSTPSTSSASSASGGSGGSSTYSTNQGLVKVKNGIKAPSGFHYMPNGSLMSDFEHVRGSGYDEKTLITNFNLLDLNYLGETRTFEIQADAGAVFDIEIHDDAAGSSTFPKSYYNFDTKVFGEEKDQQRLQMVEATGQGYLFDVVFPAVEFTVACTYNNDPTIVHADDGGKIVAGMTVTGTGIPDGSFVKSVTSNTRFELGDALGGTDVDTTGGSVSLGTLTFAGIKKYTINVYAKTVSNIKTKHSDYKEFKNADGSVNINKSLGSNSDLLSKEIYQDVKKNIQLSCIAPRLEVASTDSVNGTVSSSNRIVVDELATVLQNMALGDKVTGTGIAAASHVLITKINPDGDNVKEIEVNQAVSVSDEVLLTVTPKFNGLTPSSSNTTGGHVISLSSNSSLKTRFSITLTALAGRTFSASRLPTTADLCAITTVDFAAAANPIQGEGGEALFYRWPVDNVAKLRNGMALDPSRRGTGQNTTAPAYISDYSASKTIMELDEKKYHTGVKSSSIQEFYVKGIDAKGNPIISMDRNGVVSNQEGELTFSTQQADALKSDAGVRIIGHGKQNIKALTGIEVEISNVKIESTNITTTTVGASSLSFSLAVSDASNISTGSTVSGANINPLAVNPKVLSKSAATGAGTLTLSSVQSFEDGQTLNFDGCSNTLTITGEIEILKMGISDATLFFDVEKFINAQ